MVDFKYGVDFFSLLAESETNSSIRTVEWKNNKVIMIDQTKLPNQLVFVEYDDYNQVADAIRSLVVRGAPAIGVSGAFGLSLAALQSNSQNKEDLISDLQKAKQILFETRPTAVNLAWGLEKIMKVAESGNSVDEIKDLMIKAAKDMADTDIEINKTMGKFGAELFENNDTIMTHCNAGALATVARAPALQWVIMISLLSNNSEPNLPIVLFISISSSAISLAAVITWSFISSTEFPDSATFIICSRPQARFTAVGLVSNRICLAFWRSEIRFSFVVELLCNAAKANPNAPETPIAGAPLTTKFRIAFATSL